MNAGYRPGVAKILVVDDDQDIQRLLAVRLAREGHEVAFAADGISAIASARREQPQLILLDVGLPAGDGFTVLERLHAIPQLAAIPVIVMSARDSHETVERALEAGAERFVPKPFEMDELLAAVRAVLAS